ncbi:MAG: LacI family DNA-binding transcriptional regulator [Atopobiaceae bacterium]|nr:LacI family DNA-binding transcriptional regulator [Atopobiaceae bacterium]
MDINEIARRAGVSRATVSRYLNNGYVSQEKRELISRIIRETGYVPSQHAQQLRTGKTRLVGVVIPKINSQSVSRMVAGITDVLGENNYQVVLANTNNNEHTEVDFLNLFAKRNHVDGMILIATQFTNAHHAAIKHLRVPLVVLGQRLPGHDCVYHDDYHAVFDLTSLALRSSRTPGYLGVFEEDQSAGHERRRGFVDACAAAGISLAPEAMRVVSFDADSGYFGAEQILDALPEVDAIVCATDDIAFGATMCMIEYGKRVPEDVQITGVGDSLLSRITHPSLTTAHLPFKTSGMEAARLLLHRIESGNAPVQEVKMGYEVYARNSIR